ncbi:MAG: hypothetical protein ABIG84_01630 [archaeon]
MRRLIEEIDAGKLYVFLVLFIIFLCPVEVFADTVRVSTLINDVGCSSQFICPDGNGVPYCESYGESCLCEPLPELQCPSNNNISSKISVVYPIIYLVIFSVAIYSLLRFLLIKIRNKPANRIVLTLVTLFIVLLTFNSAISNSMWECEYSYCDPLYLISYLLQDIWAIGISLSALIVYHIIHKKIPPQSDKKIAAILIALVIIMPFYNLDFGNRYVLNNQLSDIPATMFGISVDYPYFKAAIMSNNPQLCRTLIGQCYYMIALQTKNISLCQFTDIHADSAAPIVCAMKIAFSNCETMDNKGERDTCYLKFVESHHITGEVACNRIENSDLKTRCYGVFCDNLAFGYEDYTMEECYRKYNLNKSAELS